MKKIFALLFAGLSGLYLLTAGPMIDPIPFLDEGIMLVIFAKSLLVLGVDISRFVPFMGGKSKASGGKPGPVVDV